MGDQQYQYRSLDAAVNEIRILCWLPPLDDDDDEVRCELVHRSLDASPEYDAISYVWGELEPARLIYIGGTPMSITPNLHGALRQIRQAGRDVWVDSLCINQRDDRERGAQVAIMGRIYAQADIVIAWLGEGGDDGTNLALRFLEVLKDELVNGDERSRRLLLNDPASDVMWDAVGNMFRLPYWSRVWIVQEVLLAQNPVLCCGADSCAWEFVQLLLLKLGTRAITILSASAREALLYPVTDLARTLARLYDARFSGKRMALMNCLVLGRQRGATDARDYVYGVLSLVEDCGIVPDYLLTMEEVYTNLVPYMIETDGNLDILSACLPGKPRTRPTNYAYVPKSYSPHLLNNPTYSFLGAGSIG
jgi:hypothetical protein